LGEKHSKRIGFPTGAPEPRQEGYPFWRPVPSLAPSLATLAAGGSTRPARLVFGQHLGGVSIELCLLRCFG
jgi:hypothetical protein